jgi:hypothetical protein
LSKKPLLYRTIKQVYKHKTLKNRAKRTCKWELSTQLHSETDTHHTLVCFYYLNKPCPKCYERRVESQAHVGVHVVDGVRDEGECSSNCQQHGGKPKAPEVDLCVGLYVKAHRPYAFHKQSTFVNQVSFPYQCLPAIEDTRLRAENQWRR